MVCPVSVSVRQSGLIYEDTIEWDVLCPHNSPEAFARRTVADLGETSRLPCSPLLCAKRRGSDSEGPGSDFLNMRLSRGTLLLHHPKRFESVSRTGMKA